MKYLSIILISLNCFSQKTIVVDYTLHSEIVPGQTVETDFRLYSNQEKYLYNLITLGESSKNDLKLDNEEQEKDEITVVQRIIDNETIFFTYTDFNAKKTITSDNIDQVKYLIEEDTPSLKWEILNETKKIDKYICKKAKTYFRGREYYGWFTEEIPNSGGPWKFNNTPGLLLEVADVTNKYHWYATKININDTPFQIPNVNYKKIDLKTSVQLIEDFYKKRSEITNSRLSEGAYSVQSKIIRSGFEIKYEWEN